jgi:integron integrase
MATLKEVFWAKIHELHRSRNTGKSYWNWIEEYCRFYAGKDGVPVSPRTLGKDDVVNWLNYLTNHKRVSESAHEQAFYAILFLYNKVCNMPLECVRSERPKPKVNVPVVMTQDEVARLIGKLAGYYRLLGLIMYGCGMRRSESLSLRLKDVDIGNRMFSIWHSKHKHSRTVPMPESIVPALQRQIDYVLKLKESDSNSGTGGIIIPRGDVTRRKASFEAAWYWLFPSEKLSRDPESKQIARYHLDDTHLGSVVRNAAKQAGLVKRVGCHTFRHSYATHLLLAGVNIREIQRLLGHRDVRTTMIYTHVSLFADRTTPNPLDRLGIASQLAVHCG